MNDNFCYVFIGTNKTGKSSVVRKHIKIWKRANPGKQVVAFDPQRMFKGLVDVYIKLDNDLWMEEILDMRNILLVIDDFRKLHDSNHPPKGLRTLLIDFCDYNISIMTIFHNPADVWDLLNSHATHYFIFKTNSKEGKFKEKIPNSSLCIVASYYVNKYVKQFGRGSYKTGEDFPHIFIDTDSGKLIAVNMKKKINK